MKVVISGYYGFGNAGDEAILEAMLAELRAARPDVRPVVLSAAPERTAARFEVEAASRMSVTAALGALRGASLFISGGGSLLQDATGWGSVPYYGGLMWLAKRLGVPVFVYAQGVGPIRRPALRVLARRVLNDAVEVTVRDRLSFDLLRGWGVDEAKLSVTADPVFGLAADGPVLRGPRTTASTSDGPLVGVALRPLPGIGEGADGRLVDALAAALAPRLEAWDARVVLLPLHEMSDGLVLHGLRQKLAAAGAGERVVPWEHVVPPKRAEAAEPAAAGPTESAASGGDKAGLFARDWVRLFAQLDICVTMRLHGLIFSACAGTPFVAVSDDPKVAAHVDELGLSREQCLVSPSVLSAETFGGLLDSVWRRRVAWRPVLQAAAAVLAKRARKTAERALHWAKR